MSNVSDLIASITTGDDEATKDIFNSVMADKMGSALEAKRIDVASSIYNTTMGDQDVDVQGIDDEYLGSEE